MTIKETIVDYANRMFRHTIFKNRDESTIFQGFQSTIHGSYSTPAIPIMNAIEVEHLDETHDKIKFIYDDATIDVIAEWRMNSQNAYILMRLQPYI